MMRKSTCFAESETSLDIEKGKLSELVQENNDLKQEIIQLKEGKCVCLLFVVLYRHIALWHLTHVLNFLTQTEFEYV